MPSLCSSTPGANIHPQVFLPLPTSCSSVTSPMLNSMKPLARSLKDYFPFRGGGRKHHGTRIRYADYYNPPLRFAADPAKYVIPDTYVSWDGIHLTEAAYRLIPGGWLNGPYANPPIVS
ncbi:hypothetical protein GW17_00038225 [Ensete ventricosum]|nr:hypothetical protein GW17_00038225 [Ensete ventricosum]